jgi:hypothetical protein
MRLLAMFDILVKCIYTCVMILLARSVDQSQLLMRRVVDLHECLNLRKSPILQEVHLRVSKFAMLRNLAAWHFRVDTLFGSSG